MDRIQNSITYLNSNFTLTTNNYSRSNHKLFYLTNSLEGSYALTISKSIENILLSNYEIWIKAPAINTDGISKRLSINCTQNEWNLEWLKSLQNFDGGFGLAKGYAQRTTLSALKNTEISHFFKC